MNAFGTFFAGFARLLRFLPVYLWELLKSNVRVAGDVLRPRPGFVAGFTEIDLSGYGPTAQWAAACLISMTPGTLSMDLDAQSGRLTVHCLYLQDAAGAREELVVLVRRALGPGATNL